MTVLEATTAATIEAAIKAKSSIDEGAREALLRLTDKTVSVSVPTAEFTFVFSDGDARVLSGVSVGSEEGEGETGPDLSIRGSFPSVFEAVLSKNEDSVAVSGETELLDDFRRVFRPIVQPGEVAEQIRAVAEYGVAAVRSAIEALAGHSRPDSSTSDPDQARQMDAMARQVDELKATVDELKQRLSESDKR